MKHVLLGTVAAMAMISGAYAQDGGMNGPANGPAATNGYQPASKVSQRQWPLVATAGFEAGFNYFDDHYEGDDGTTVYYRGDFNALYHFPNSNYALGLNGFYRDENMAEADELDEGYALNTHWEVGGKVYKILSRRSRVGIFGGYGKQGFEDDEFNMSLAMAGIEGQHQISDEFLIFGQLGFGDSDGYEDGANGYEYGFGRGYVVRGGVTWFGCWDSAFTADVELANASHFVSSDSEGDIFAVSFYGETPLPVGAPLSLGYGIRYGAYNSGTFSENQNETDVFVRLTYTFGANTPKDRWLDGDAVGMPRTPGRANFHGVWMDEN